MNLTFTFAAAASLALLASSALASDAVICSSRVDRSNVVTCALAASLSVRAEGYEVEAAAGRRLAVSPLLPSNPVLSLAAATRSTTGQDNVTNWNATLSQELEVAGQRGVRRRAAEADIEARKKRALVIRREVAASAWFAFFDAVAAREEQRLVAGLSAATERVSLVAHARADQGLIAPLDADVADAIAIRVSQAKLASERRLAGAGATLASLLGRDPADGQLTVEGELVPLEGVKEVAAALVPKEGKDRPEVLALDAERRAFELRADAYRRTRIPNPTVSVFAQNDGFNERVLGVGVSFPIPLPGNIGRTYIGEIAESEAIARRVATDRERIARDIRLEIVTAAKAYDSRETEVRAFTPARVTRADESLRALAQELEAGRVSVRDAVVVQQALIELLQANVAARRAWCFASVDLARAVGFPLERGTP